MWHDVFGPIFQQTSQMALSAGTDYTTAMTSALAGSNLPANEKAQLAAQYKGMGSLMSQIGQNQTQLAVAQPSVDAPPRQTNWPSPGIAPTISPTASSPSFSRA